MSDFQQRDGSGQLFKNDRATEDRHPSHKGTFLLNGVTYEIAAWVKEGRKGRFFSLKVQEQREWRQDGGSQSSGQSSGQAQGTASGFSNGVRTRAPGEMPMPPTGGPGRRKPMDIEDDIPFAPEVR